MICLYECIYSFCDWMNIIIIRIYYMFWQTQIRDEFENPKYPSEQTIFEVLLKISYENTNFMVLCDYEYQHMF